MYVRFFSAMYRYSFLYLYGSLGGNVMKVEKVINNNIVRSFNDRGQEVLVMGSGLGFKKSVGDSIDDNKIEKIYRIEQEQSLSYLEDLLTKIPLEHVQITNEIVDYAQISLAKELPQNIYTTLMDHVSFALQRYEENIPIHNALLWEIKRFYNHEYLIGREAVEMINHKFSVNLPEDEAGFIAMHLASANLSSTGEAEKTMRIIQDILNIIKYHFNVELKENSIHYERLITHLKFFVQRVFSGKAIKNEEQEFMIMIKNQYQNEYQCSLKIYEYFLNEYNVQLSNDEMVYLTIHIRRVTSE